MNTFECIVEELNKCAEGEKFINFITPLLKSDLRIIGVKTPNLKKIAKKYSKGEIDGFIINYSYETNFVYVINLFTKAKSIDECFISATSNSDLIDNWALTDSSFKYIKTYKVFEKDEVVIDKFLGSNDEFIIRYGFLLLFEYAKDKKYTEVILKKVFDSEYFYVMMVEAWLISICAVYNFDETYKFIKTSNINKETKLKAISKCVDSFRITDEQKDKLKELRKEIRK